MQIRVSRYYGSLIYFPIVNSLRQVRSRALLVLAAAVFLRAVVPAGYMPSSVGSGLLFELCPEGVPAEFMAMLSGSKGHDHGDQHSEHHEAGGHDCSMGHLLLSAAAVDNSADNEVAPATPVFAIVPRYSFTSAVRTHYHSRGPPA